APRPGGRARGRARRRPAPPPHPAALRTKRPRAPGPPRRGPLGSGALRRRRPRLRDGRGRLARRRRAARPPAGRAAAAAGRRRERGMRFMHLANHGGKNVGNAALVLGLERILREDLPFDVSFLREPWDLYTLGRLSFDERFVERVNAECDVLLVGAA